MSKKPSLAYFDGNTVTALWTYAQHFALDDNSFGTTFGPCDPTQPTDCPLAARSAEMTGKNIGDLRNDKHVTWGFFSDGFQPTERRADGTAVCGKSATNRHGLTDTVYDSGNEGFSVPQSSDRPISTVCMRTPLYCLSVKVLVLELAVVALLAACSSERPAGPPSDPSAGQPPAEHPVGSPFDQSAPQPTATAIVSTRVARLPSVEMLAEARTQLGNLHAIGHLTIHAPRVTTTQPPAHPFDASSTVVVSAEWLEAFDGSPLVERPFRLPTTIPYFAIKAALAHTATPELATSALAKLFAIKQIAVLRYVDHDYVAPEIAADGLGRISGWLEIYDVATRQRIGGLTFDFAQTPATKGDFAEQVRSSIEERVTWYATAFPPAAQ